MAIKPTLRREDFNDNDALLQKGQAALDAAWARANPEGTLAQNFQKPAVTSADTGGIADWGAVARGIDRSYDRDNTVEGVVNGANEKGDTEALIESIRNGTVAKEDIADNYSALAARKMDEAARQGSFNYNFNADPLFKMLSQSYMQQAQKAASNAAANAAARTGGYGNSYGAAAASQQYNQALSGLYDQVPELEQAAYSRWLQDRQDLYDQADRYEALGDKYYSRGVYDDETAYARGRDAVSDQRYETEWQHGLDREARADMLEDREAALTNALAAAEYGNVSKLAELLGTELENPKDREQLDILLSLYASGDENARSLIYKMLGMDYTGNITQGQGGGQSTTQGQSGRQSTTQGQNGAQSKGSTGETQTAQTETLNETADRIRAAGIGLPKIYSMSEEEFLQLLSQYTS